MRDLGKDRMGDKLTKAREVFQKEGFRGFAREAFWFPYRRAISMLAAIRGQQRLRIGKVALLFHIQSYAEALHLIQTFQTENECLRYLASRLHEGDVFWDVGAYHGLYAMLAARLGGKVIAFEPYGPNAQRIRENARLNRCEDHIQVMTLALSDRHGMASFDVRGGQRSFMMGHITAGPRSALNVRTVPGDSLVASGIPAPDIVKIDVEGHELHVLWGMRETLRRHVHAMICEVHAEYLARHGKSGSVERFLQSLEFRVFRIRDRWTEYFLAAERVAGP
jgi:methyltransferase, FkbM family